MDLGAFARSEALSMSANEMTKCSRLAGVVVKVEYLQVVQHADIATSDSKTSKTVLERRKLELQVEIHALEREKDDASKERLRIARKAIADVDDKLAPLKAAYENEKKRGDEITDLRRRIDELKAKADDAERR